MAYGIESKHSLRRMCSPKKNLLSSITVVVFSMKMKLRKQAVRRFWEQRMSLKSVDAKREAVYSPPMTAEAAHDYEGVAKSILRRHLHTELLPRATAANEAEVKGRQSITIAAEKTMSRRLVVACQRCREAGMKCDREKPVCTACKGAWISVACTYMKQRKNNR